MASILPHDFYLSTDTVLLARKLLGKVIVTRFDGLTTAGMITETEAYNGVVDRASHAYGGRRTRRTETMYQEGGVAYVYLCYGVHHLFNVVTGPENMPNAVLLRGIAPLSGEDIMLKRRGLKVPKRGWVGGPGTSTTALGIQTVHDGTPLNGKGPIEIWDCGFDLLDEDIDTGPRVGVDYAGEDALLPWRFLLSRNRDRYQNNICL